VWPEVKTAREERILVRASRESAQIARNIDVDRKGEKKGGGGKEKKSAIGKGGERRLNSGREKEEKIYRPVKGGKEGKPLSGKTAQRFFRENRKRVYLLRAFLFYGGGARGEEEGARAVRGEREGPAYLRRERKRLLRGRSEWGGKGKGGSGFVEGEKKNKPRHLWRGRRIATDPLPLIEDTDRRNLEDPQWGYPPAPHGGRGEREESLSKRRIKNRPRGEGTSIMGGRYRLRRRQRKALESSWERKRSTLFLEKIGRLTSLRVERSAYDRLGRKGNACLFLRGRS